FLSGVFFPVNQLPAALSAIMQWLPLAPAINLIRPLVLGQWPQQPGWYVAQLVCTAAVSIWLAAVLARRRLLR
nr:nodulation protein NodJ [Pseudomonas sp.]